MAELQKSRFKTSLSTASCLLLLELLLWLNLTERASMAAAITVRVGVILDLDSPLGQMVNNSLALATHDVNNNGTATKIDLIVKNVSQHDVVAAADAASYLIENQKVHAILGPQNSEQARYIVKLGEEFQVPVIWLPITGPSLSPPPSPSSIYSDQGLNCFQFQAIADTIKALGWQSIVPIYEETEYGSQLIPCLTNVLKDMGTRMVNVVAIDPNSNVSEINSALDTLNITRTHVFLVHLGMDVGTRFIVSAKEKGMTGEGYAWILTQELSSLTDPRVRKPYRFGDSVLYDKVPLRRSMQGALGVRPMDLGYKKSQLRKRVERKFSRRFKSGLTMYGWWAYHTIEALAKALEKTGTDNNGAILRKEILKTNFEGASGIQFDLRKGQLNQSELEVYNVIGDRERIIGSWSPEAGLAQNYSKGGEKSAGNNKYKLIDPLWPGDTLDKPPRLRIGVPTTNTFPEFVNVDVNKSSNVDERVDGFAIDVFLKAVEVLPFRLNNYEFVALPNNTRSGTPMYDHFLCTQMIEENLDAIIGDITIVGSRTKCVDFTFPYLESSVSMVVRVKSDSRRKGLLMKPFSQSLWAILLVIFVVATAIIIFLYWVKTNKAPPVIPLMVYKIDVMENFASSAAGWLVILTSFLFILVLQIYTANLTSILTQPKEKEPLFKNESEVKEVGYRKGSWVEGLLIEQIGFNPSYQIKPLGSLEEYSEALSKGTKNGGVDAIFDETPYLTLFLSKYKSRFMMTGPEYKTGGFAFAFPKKSSLAKYFSKAILKVTQDVEPYRVMMAKRSLPTSIEDLEFEDQNDVETRSLNTADLGGLYPILSVVAGLFLIFYIPKGIKHYICS